MCVHQFHGQSTGQPAMIQKPMTRTQNVLRALMTTTRLRRSRASLNAGASSSVIGQIPPGLRIRHEEQGRETRGEGLRSRGLGLENPRPLPNAKRLVNAGDTAELDTKSSRT